MNRRPRPARTVALEKLDTPMLQAARRLYEQHRYDEALERFDLAVRTEPDNLLALINAARAHGLRHHHAQAVALLRRLERQAPHHPEVPQHIGETLRQMALHGDAIAYFERAAHMNPRNTRVLLELATIYERVHRLEDALEAVTRLQKLEPASIPARLVRARVERRQGRVEDAIATLRTIVTGQQFDFRLTADAWGALAQAFDESGDYDSAWEAIERCKLAQMPHAHAPRAAAAIVGRRFARMMDELGDERLERWRNTSIEEAPRRVALMTSFPRSGTTLLEQILTGSPDLVSSEEKNIFSADIFPFLGRGKPDDFPIVQLLEETTPGQITEARARYLETVEQCQREPLGARWHLDKNPAMNPMIPAVLRVFPEMRLIVPLRDPRDVVLSCYLRYLPLSPMSVHFLTLESTVSKYVEDMRAWLRFRRQLQAGWLEVRYEDIVTDLSTQARRVFDFLDLPWSDEAVKFQERARQRAVTSPSYAEVTAPVHSRAVERWRRYERQFEPHLEPLNAIARELGYE